MRKIVLTSCFILTVITADSCAEEKPSEKEIKALELLEVMGGDEMFDDILSATMTQAFAMQRQKLDSNDQKKFDEYTEAARAVTLDLSPEFTEKVALVYAKHFSADELDGLIDFYKSPIGQKMITKMPELTADSMQIGMEISEEILERLKTVDASE